MKTIRQWHVTGLAVVAGLLALALDQFSKWVVLRELGPGSSRDVVTVIPHTLWFIFVRNTGSAFGLFQGRSSILKVIAIVAVAALAVYYMRAARGDRVVALALGLQVGGAVGNIIDRFRHGYVVDWITVPHFPTFNVADSSITIGVALLMYALIFRDGINQAPGRSGERGVDAQPTPLADGGHDD
jgi:signal peptidase II